MFSVTTFNIRFDDTSERKKSWELRKTLTKSLLDKYQWDFMGVEEPLLPQMRDMKEMQDWDYFGVGRDDGFEKGEFTAVFYNSTRFTLLQEGHFWLSETLMFLLFTQQPCFREFVFGGNSPIRTENSSIFLTLIWITSLRKLVYLQANFY